jgi:hypothetical protein
LATRRAKFACAILAGLIGTAVLTLLPRIPAAVADDCLTAPTGDKADGQHWRYRLERGRRCWYLKDSTAAAQNSAEDAAPRQANQASSAWDFALPTAPKLTPRRGTGPAPRVSTEALADDDARAAAKPQPATRSLLRTRPETSFDDSLQHNTAAPSWQPLASAEMDSPAPAPAAAASPAPDAPPPASDPAASTPPTDSPVGTPVKPVKHVAPIRKLLMVVVGALSLSGLLASALYRLSKVGRRRRRNRNWQRAITRVRRNRDKPRSKSKVVHAKGRSGRAAEPPKMAPAPAAKQATQVVAVKSKPTVAATPAAADPAAELADLLASRVAKAAPPHVPVTAPRPDGPLPEVTAPVPAENVDPAAELVDLLGSHAAKRAAQPPPAVEIVQPPAPTPAEATPPRLPLVADPAAELADLLQSRFAPPPPPAKPVTTQARPRPPTAPVNTAVPKVIDPIAELANLLEAKEGERAARFGNADAVRHGSAPPAMPPELSAAAKPVDPAVELFDMLQARAARTTSPPAPAPQPVKAVRPPEPIKPVSASAAEAVKPAQPDKAPRGKTVAPSVRIDSAPASRIQAAAEPTAHANTPPRASIARPDSHKADNHKVDHAKAGSPSTGTPKNAVSKNAVPRSATSKSATSKNSTPKIAPPKPGKGARRAADEAALRRKGKELPPLPPALMLEPENNGPTPPLDFIPRPQALRPRLRDISQDESLDGVQDILARLAQHG